MLPLVGADGLTRIEPRESTLGPYPSFDRFHQPGLHAPDVTHPAGVNALCNRYRRRISLPVLQEPLVEGTAFLTAV